MKRKNRNNKFLVSFVALFVLLFGVGYAYLNQRLDVTGKISVESMCPIVFDGVMVDNIESTVEETTPVSRREDNKTIIDFDVELYKPGDVYSFVFDAVNEGPESKCDDVCISNIELRILDENNANFTALELEKIKKALKYELVYDGTNVDVMVGNTLPAETRKHMRLNVKYSTDIDIEDILNSNFDIRASLILTYAFECPVLKYKLTVDPDGGTWRNSTEIREIYLAEREKEYIEDPVKIDDGDELPFVYWWREYREYNTNDEGEVTFRTYIDAWNPKEDKNIFEMPGYDVTIKAEYRSKECNGTGYKAQNIQTGEKYCWLQDAIDDASDGQGVRLLKNTDESPYNNTPTNTRNDIYIDFEGYSLYGTFINPVGKKVQIYHGTIQALDYDEFEYNGTTFNKGVGFINDGHLIMGQDDETVYVEDSISIIGRDTALKQNGTFEFYDGYLEGYKGLAGTLGTVTNCPMATCNPSPEGYFVISEHINAKNRQKVYLSRNIGRAVAVGNIFYYNLQDGINDQTEIVNPAKELRIVRDQWQAAYLLNIPADNVININMDGFEFTTGNTITVNGELNIYNNTEKEDTEPKINLSESITVNGKMTVDGLEIKGTNSNDVIINKGDLEVKSGKINAVSNAYAINNTSSSKSITLGAQAVITNENSTNLNSLYNNATQQIVLDNGTVFGLLNNGNLLLTGVFRGRDLGNGYAVTNQGTLEVNSNDIDVPKLLNSTGTLIYRDAGVTYTDFTGGTGYVYSGTYENFEEETIHLTGGTMNIEGGSFDGQDCGLINSGATLNLNAGTIHGNVNGLCNQAGRTYQNGSTITGDENAVLAGAGGSLYVNGGDIIGDQYGIVMTRSRFAAPGVEINGGHVEGLLYDGVKTGVGGLTVNGGLIEGYRYGISNPYVAGGYSCDFHGCYEPTEANVSIPQINGGTIKGGTYGIYNEYIVTFGSDDRDIKIDYPDVYGSLYGIYNSNYARELLNSSDRAFNFFDGRLSGKTGAFFYQEDGVDEQPRNATEADITETETVITEEDNEKYLEEGIYETKFNALVEPYLQINDDTEHLYTSIDRASKAASAGDTIKVIKDVEVTYPQAFVYYKNVTFDINGHNVRFDYETVANSNVYLTDSVGTGLFKNGKDFVFRAGGTVDSINIENIYSGTIRNDNGLLVTVKDSTILSNNTALVGGRINVESGTITSKNGYAYQAYGTISGGTLTSNSTHAVQLRGELTVTGGNIISLDGMGINGDGNNVYFRNGNITSAQCGINNVSHLEFNDGLIKSDTDGICINDSYREAYILGGKVVAENFGINSYGILTLGENDGTVSITSPEIIGKEKGIYQTGRKFEWFDGIVKSLYKRYDGIVSLVPNTYVVFEDEEVIDGTNYRTAYLDDHVNFLKVGNQEFNDFNAAAEVAQETNNVIYLIRDARTEMKSTVESTYDIAFDLNGHSLITTQPIIVNGKLEMRDSKGNGGINNIRYNTFTVDDEAELTFNGGDYTATYEDYVVVSEGKVTINAGTLHNENYRVVFNSGDTYINGGEISTSGYCGRGCHSHAAVLATNGNVYIEGGLITDGYGAGIENAATTVMNGGEINVGGSGINSGETTMNGGYIYSDSNGGIETGTLATMNGGKIESGNVGIRYVTNIVVNGGEILTHNDGIAVASSLIVNEGIIKSETKNGVSNGSTATILGGYIEGGMYGVYNEGTLTLGTKDGDVHITPPVIVGDINGLFIYSSGEYNATTSFYDGILKGQTNAYTSSFTETEVDTAPIIDHELINDIEYETAYLVNDVEFVKNLNTGVTYKNLQTAVTNAGFNHTLQIIASAPVYYDVIVDVDDKITLDLNNFVISTTKGITNNGILTVIDSSQEKEGTISTAVVQNLFKNTGTLTISDISISNTYSSRYLITSSGELILNRLDINAVNAIDNDGTATITDTYINASNTGIYNKSELTVNNGKIETNNYDIYSVSNEDVTITGTTFDMIGNDWYKQAIYIASGESNVVLDDISILHGWLTNKVGNTVQLKNSEVNYAISNDGTMGIDNSEVNVNCLDTKYQTPYWPYAAYSQIGIENHGTLTLKNGTVLNADFDSTKSGNMDAISTNTTLNIEDSTINVGYEDSGRVYKGLNIYGQAVATIEDTDINILGGATGYGIYQDNANSQVFLKTGHIVVNNVSLAYGIYNQNGETTYGVSSGGLEDVSEDEVDRLNPLIEAYGTQGTGVKKVDGKFYYYDGKIIASTHSLPETASDIEHNWEATTYFDVDTGNEYTVLEYMLEDYNYAMVARLNGVYYTTLQSAIDHVDSDRNRVEVLKNIQEDVVIPEDVNVKLDINNHRVTGKQINNGTLTLINGSLTNYADTALINNGTLIMGVNDGVYKQNNLFIYVEGLYDFDEHIYLGDKAVISDGDIKLYDGYIEGMTAVDGNITSKAVGYQVHTEHVEVQPTTYCNPELYNTPEDKAKCEELNEVILYEKKYLVEYEGTDDSCDSGHFLYLDPAGGTYHGSTDIFKVCLEKSDVYTVGNAKLENAAFKGWNETSETNALNGNTVTMGDEDVELLAQYEYDSSKYVAQINEDPYYYVSLSDAILDADSNDVVNLLKDTTENVESNNNVTINLNEHTVTGSITNNSSMTLTNGTVTSSDIAIINYGTLTIGTLDNEISDTSIIITGETIGIKNDGTFNFYDGTITGGVSKVDRIPEDTYVYVSNENNVAVARLVTTEPTVIAKTKVGTPLYFDNINDGFNAVGFSKHTLYLLQDVSINYALCVEEGRNVTFDMQGYEIDTNQAGYNYGELTIISTSDDRAIINMSSKSFDNSGTMTINNIYMDQATNEQTAIYMSGILNMVNSKTNSNNWPSIYVRDHDGYYATELNVDSDSEVSTNTHTGSLYLAYNSNMIEITDGLFTNGVYNNYGKLTISGNVKMVTSNSKNLITNYNGIMVINDIEATTYNYDLFIAQGGSTTINGGTFNANSSINNMYGMVVYDGIVDINDLTINTNNSAILNSNASLTINGGTFNATNYGLYQYAGTTNVGTNDDEVSITNPSFTGLNTAIIFREGTVNMYDGIFKGNNIYENGEIDDVPRGYTLINGVETLEDETVLNTMYLSKTGDFLQVGNDTYNNLNDASAAITETNNTITLISNASVKYAQKIESEYPIIFDLNGFTLASDKDIESYGTVTITDSTNAKEGALTNSKTNTIINKSGTLTLQEGSYSSSCSECSTIANDSTNNDEKTIHVVNATILSANSYGLNGNKGNLIIDNANIRSKGVAIYTGSTSSDTLVINGGRFESTNADTISVARGSHVEINGGTILGNSADTNPITITNVPDVEITGGTVDSTSNGNSAIVMSNVSGTISGGSFESNYACVNFYSGSGTLDITGGTFTSSRAAINARIGTVNITGGTLVGDQYGVYVEGSTVNIGKRDMTINIESPDITGNLYGLYISSGSANFYDGIIRYQTGITAGLFNSIEDETYIYSYEENGYTNSYLKNAPTFVRNIATSKEYKNLQTAIDEQIASEELELINDFTIFDTVSIPNNKTVTLNFNNHELNITKAVTNRGTFNLRNTTGNTALLRELGSVDLITNYGTLDVLNVDLTNASNKNVINNQDVLNIENSNIISIAGCGIYTTSGYTLSNVDINAATYGIFDESNSYTSTYDEGTINSDATAIYIRNEGTRTYSQLNITAGSIQNTTAAILSLSESSIAGGISNSATLTIDELTQDITTDLDSYTAITNSGTMTITNLDLDLVSSGTNANGIENTGTLTVDDITVDIDGINTNGIYMTDGTLTLGTNDNNVFDNLPHILATGTTSGNGVKVTSGQVYFYDGEIVGSNPFDYDTTIPSDYVKRTYYLSSSDVYRTILEEDGSAISNDYVALANKIYFEELQKAIDVSDGKLVTLLRDDDENITNDNDSTLDLGGYTLTGNVVNTGSLVIVNGSIEAEDGITLTNSGTLTMMSSDIYISQTDPHIYNKEGTALKNTGVFNFYSGLLEGPTSINGNITATANGYKAKSTETDDVVKTYLVEGILEIKNYEYTGQYQTFIARTAGTYKIEAWGAQGGTDTGFGGYTSGEIYLTRGQILYIYVGGRGTNGVSSGNGGGWNGGGNAGANGTSRAGGGATDIRLVNTSEKNIWNESASIASRIMVAGGGAGAEAQVAADAGGLNGGAAANGTYATQTSGSAFGYGVQPNYDASGPGGGYWGGTLPGGDARTAGGGSSYISGHTGSVAIRAQNDTSPKPIECHEELVGGNMEEVCTYCETGTSNNSCSIHYSNKSFTNTIMIDGSGYEWTNEKGEKVGMVLPNGNTANGNTGNGYARITLLEEDENAETVIYRYFLNDGEISSPPMKENTRFVSGYCSNGVTIEWDEDEWVKIVHNDLNVEATCNLYFGQEMALGLTEQEETFTAGQTGNYRIEVWGAEGGYAGGPGAYATGIINLTQGETIYIHVGGDGDGGWSGTINGGYNGGGTTVTSGQGGSGGGATSVAFVQGELSELYDSKGSLSQDETYYISNDIIMVAAGGGGGASYNGYYANGTPGGGYISLDASGGSSRVGSTISFGANQTGTNGDYGYDWGGRTSKIGSFGQGGQGAGAYLGGGAGGAGFYGGAGGFDITAGAGGSSYIANPRLTNKKMVTFGTDESLISMATETKTEITECENELPTSNCAKLGTGYFKITYLSSTTSNNKLSSLQVNGYNLLDSEGNVVTFDPDVHQYYVTGKTLDYKINATTVNTKAIIDGIGDISVGFGNTSHRITVGDGLSDEETYTIIFKVDSVDFDYTGEEETIKIPANGTYKIEIWGAQGGNAGSLIGGYGAYSVGTINLNKNERLFINVGGQGSTVRATTIDGGYNGGGKAHTGNYNDTAGSGGGATSVARVTGELKELSLYKGTLEPQGKYYISNSIIEVAGGGGGAYYYGSFYSNGGAGGGNKGASAPTGYCAGRHEIIGDSATQIAPGTLNGCDYSGTDDAAFGQGGSTDSWYAGGGGGFYGGGHGYAHGASGGSGYIANSKLFNKKMVMYSTDEAYISNELDTKTEITTCAETTPTSDCSKKGAGYFKITLLDSSANEEFFNISNIEVEDHTLYDNNNNEITFDISVKDYYVTTTEEQVTIVVDADTSYTIVNAGAHDINLGNNNIPVVITTPAGETIMYTIHVYLKSKSYEYTGTYQTFTVPETGVYKIELWGAQGADHPESEVEETFGGKGAYTSGLINLYKNEKLYLYVGPDGKDDTSKGDNIDRDYGTYYFNGASGGNYTCYNYYNGSQAYNNYAGSATDIRITSGNWDYEPSLASRIMVASGGAAANENEDGVPGGALNGFDGTHGTGATQTEAGGPNSGSFGKGGIPEYSGAHCGGNIGSGASSGYYGGGAYDQDRTDNGMGSAGSGSSYISGYLGCVAIKSQNEIEPKTGCDDGTDDITCSYHYSGKKFFETVMKAGNESMPTHDGTSTMIGNEGPGYAKITIMDKNANTNEVSITNISVENNVLLDNEGNTVVFDKDTKEYYVNAQSDTVNIIYTIGNNYTIDNAGEHKLSLGTNKILVSVVTPEKDIISYIFNIYLNSIDIDYSGDEEELDIINTGNYKIEVWGAQGGYANSYAGGYGGYSTGTTSLSKGEKLYINVGGEGQGSNSSCQNLSGGYNGGGDVNANCSVIHVNGAGGGATHIATKSGLLSELENDVDKILIVAGGGGGSRDQSNHVTAARWGNGGSGGGASSGAVYNNFETLELEYRYGGVTTQEIGYAFGQGETITGNSAGGGGFLGGYGGETARGYYYGAGQGGSGYLGNLTNKVMYCYYCEDSNENHTVSTNGPYKDTGRCPIGYDTNAVSKCAKAGNGYARITILNEVEIGNISVENKIMTDDEGNTISFSIDKKDYYVSSEDETINIIYEVGNEYSVINAGEHELTFGDNIIPVIVTNPDGETLIYMFYVTRTLIQYEYTGNYQTFTAPADGYYKVELWGAQGGSIDDSIGGKGGYTSGIIELEENEKLYVYVGDDGNNTNYNGGGSHSGEDQYAGDGGGATDVRIVSGAWNNSQSLANRIMVAGGGGGSYSYNYSWAHNGGYAGGLTGGAGQYTNTCQSTGGTQTAGGTCDSYSNVAGSFGIGGNGYRRAGGGGGGYWGGAARYDMDGSGSGAGGGSSYVSGYEGCVAIKAENDITPKDDCETGTSNVECSYHFSTKKFINADIKAGNESMPTHDGTSTMEGNTGKGFAKITYLKGYIDYTDVDITNISIENNALLDSQGNTVVFQKDVREYYVEAFNDTINIIYTIGNRYQITNAGEHTLEFGENEIIVIVTTPSNDTYTYKFNVNLESIKFGYTGSEQIYNVKTTGIYKIETWGAQGGNANVALGGNGGYSYGIKKLTSGENLYIQVGGKGTDATSELTTMADGGYNGGGTGSGYCSNCYGAGGGGATHVATSSGLLSAFNSKQQDLLLVAGAGGGAGWDNFIASNMSVPGGYGGGLTAGAGTVAKENDGNPRTVGGGGATQSTGGTAASDGNAGSFGTGGSSKRTACDEWGSGAGGAGYYGGGSGNDYGASGGGGSAYINSNVFIESDTKAGNESMPTHDGTSTMTGNTGNGYVKITYLKNYTNYDILDITNISVDNNVLLDEEGNTVLFQKNVTEYYVEAFTDTIDIIYTIGNNYQITNAGVHSLNLGENQIIVDVLSPEGLEVSYTFNVILKTLVINYSGASKELNITTDGTYKLEVWGAQGGNANSSSTGKGGYGGYSVGTVNLSVNDSISIVVGGQPATSTNRRGDYTGGYNGGGNSYYWYEGSTYNGAGGGATHIALNKALGELYNYVDNKNSIIIVAGGGGGGATDGNYHAIGGSGGGFKGTNGAPPPNNDGSYGLGGTQTAGGSYSHNRRALPNEGSFGQGASSSVTSAPDLGGGAGGGGGYFGGGSGGVWGGAGGGSGYIANSKLDNKKMVVYSTSNSFISTDVDTKTEITTCTNETATPDCAKIGNGYAKITLLN